MDADRQLEITRRCPLDSQGPLGVVQQGLAALTQWVEREGADRRVPRAHGEEIAVVGDAEPVIVKLGEWVSNTESRRNKLTAGQLAALAKLGVDRA
ncbi:helicase associated domain-containing protein [Streptomyces sp. NPDC058157]|uniref:helicase associated domain-containing protein n=1 Tax=Streptomyces sp. NPDC058157 TaxID=3346360 RepID=UPI0036F008FE